MEYLQQLKATVSRNAGAVAILLAGLVVLVIALTYVLARHHAGAHEGFHHKHHGHHGHHAHHGHAAAAAAHAGLCGPGETPVTYHNHDGSTMTYCRSTDALPGPMTTCGGGWDPTATAEAQALATVGSLQHDSYGERHLQHAINAAYDSNVGLSDEQLTTLMHHGDAS